MMIRRARNNPSRIFLSLFCLSILFVSFFSFPVSAIDNKSSESRQLIRVGYPIQNGLTEIDEDGHYSGYTYEYLMEVAQYAGWDYEFVTVDGTINEQLSTLLDMLMNGKIDLMGCLAYNESLGEMFDYPSSNYGTSYYNLSVLDKNGKIDNTNFFTFNPLRVGIFGTPGQQAESLQLLAKMNNFTVEQISYSTEKDMVTALDNNEIDAIICDRY
ncbi:substrate-binding periplasmic protein [Fumia xinanensis]|uniref:Transporter substrate-binding domain-containing protein n=1 Tax=Fumia xinanensis TaxID=2763659 RepID=A0A926E3R9_9FIRM|nr:transporter substrate-binding domain-containing protein [Fumia xinanensis]MBC8559023.1 transporter substrate-binding domain-containing protein [Fumia xinanensis]